MSTPAIVALLTDFGTEDGYVAAMKGRLLTGAPAARLVDISHEVEPYNIRQAAFCLNNCYRYFPEGSIFVVVVDPGVGTSRRGLLIKSQGYFFIGPDNGVFSLMLESGKGELFEILMDSFAAPVSSTFHGRDVFAPLAGLVACGADYFRHLQPAEGVVSFVNPPQITGENEISAEVIHVDHFGNAILNIRKEHIGEISATRPRLRLGKTEVSGVHRTFGEVEKGRFLMCWDSSGYLQLACNLGNAAHELRINVGDKIRLWR